MLPLFRPVFGAVNCQGRIFSDRFCRFSPVDHVNIANTITMCTPRAIPALPEPAVPREETNQLAKWKWLTVWLLAASLLSAGVALAAAPLTILPGTAPKAVTGGPLQAQLASPYGLTDEPGGSLLIADSYNNQIKRWTDGALAVVAGRSQGTDAWGYPQGGLVDGAAAQAMFSHPRGVVVDAQGVIYVADTGNHVIRKIANGVVRTLAGSGSAGYLDGSATTARFNSPSSLVLDGAGNLLVADTLNNVIRRVAPNGTVTTYAGVASADGSFLDGAANQARFNEPVGLALRSPDTLLVVDSGNHLVRQVQSGQVSTIAGQLPIYRDGEAYPPGGFADGPALSAAFNFPKGIAVTDNGTIFVADTWNRSLRAITGEGVVLTIAGHGATGQQTGALEELAGPVGLAYCAGHLYVSDQRNHLLYDLAVDPVRPQAVEPEAGPELEQPAARPEISFDSATTNIQVWLDGQRVLFPDVQPTSIDGRTLVPLRFICQQWGASVEWLSSVQGVRVTRGEQQVEISPQSGQLTNLDGRSLVGLRHLGQAFGFSVEWVAAHRAVVIWSK